MFDKLVKGLFFFLECGSCRTPTVGPGVGRRGSHMELQTHRVVSHFLSLTGRCYMNKGSHCPLDTSHPSSGIPALNIWNALLGCVFFFFKGFFRYFEVGLFEVLIYY